MQSQASRNEIRMISKSLVVGGVKWLLVAVVGSQLDLRSASVITLLRSHDSLALASMNKFRKIIKGALILYIRADRVTWGNTL